MKIESRKNHIKSFLTALFMIMLLSVFAACSDVPNGTSKTEITSGISSLNESVEFSDFSENSVNSSFDDRTHGEYESSEKTTLEDATSNDVLTGEVSSEDLTEEFTHGEYGSGEVISEESSLETSENQQGSSEGSEETSEDRTHGEYENSEAVSEESVVESSVESIEATTSEEISQEESIPEESSLVEDVSSEEPSVEVHTCKFVKTSTFSANCTQKGYSVYKCSCGKSENREYISALGHKEGNWVVITEATVSSTGLKRKSCIRCGVKLDEEVIAKLEPPHVCNYVKSSAVAPTCTEQGYSVYRCSCGKSENREYVSALGHQEGEWVVIEDYIDTPGLKRKSCVRCGATLEEDTLRDPKYYLSAVDNWDLVEERTLYYINQYRIAEGKEPCEALLNGKTIKFARMRAEQISMNFSHDIDDYRTASTMLEFGVYHPEEPERVYDFETNEFVYTGNITPAYYNAVGGEAIGKLIGQFEIIELVARDFASGVYKSKDHWSYVGAETTEYITSGVYCGDEYGTSWYICIFTSDGFYD